jgi:NAD(P) transhydrogenase
MKSPLGMAARRLAGFVHEVLTPSACEIPTIGVHVYVMGVEYDLVVIGSGPGGQKAAIAAAKLGKSVAVIERGTMLGGVCVNTGTIPSKTLREAVVYLTGMSQRELYGASYRVKDKITPADLLARTHHVIGKEQDVVRSQLMRNRIELYTGHARFTDEHTLCVEDTVRGDRQTVTGHHIVIATGGVRRGSGAGLRRNPRPEITAGIDGGCRRGRDRHRVRVDVRRAGHQGHRRGEA